MIQLDGGIFANIGPKIVVFLVGGAIGVWCASAVLMPKIKKANDKLNRELEEKAKERQK